MSTTAPSSTVSSKTASSSPPPPPPPPASKPKPPSKKPPAPPPPSISTDETTRSRKDSPHNQGDEVGKSNTHTKRPKSHRSPKAPEGTEVQGPSAKPPPPKKPPPSKDASPPANKPRKGKRKPPPPAKKPPVKAEPGSETNEVVTGGTDAKTVGEEDGTQHTQENMTVKSSNHTNVSGDDISTQHTLTNQSDNADKNQEDVRTTTPEATMQAKDGNRSSIEQGSIREETQFNSESKTPPANDGKPAPGREKYSKRPVAKAASFASANFSSMKSSTVDSISTQQRSLRKSTSNVSRSNEPTGREQARDALSVELSELPGTGTSVSNEGDMNVMTQNSKEKDSLVGSTSTSPVNNVTVTPAQSALDGVSGSDREEPSGSVAQSELGMARQPIPGMSLGGRSSGNLKHSSTDFDSTAGLDSSQILSESVDTGQAARIPHTDNSEPQSSGSFEQPTHHFGHEAATAPYTGHSEPQLSGSSEQSSHHRSVSRRRSASSNDLKDLSTSDTIVTKRSSSSRDVSKGESETSDASKGGIFKRFTLGRKSSKREVKPGNRKRQDSIFQRLMMRSSAKKGDTETANEASIPEESHPSEEPPPLPELPSLDELGEPPEHLLKALNLQEEQSKHDSPSDSLGDHKKDPTSTQRDSDRSGAALFSRPQVAEAKADDHVTQDVTADSLEPASSKPVLDAVEEGSESEERDRAPETESTFEESKAPGIYETNTNGAIEIDASPKLTTSSCTDSSTSSVSKANESVSENASHNAGRLHGELDTATKPIAESSSSIPDTEPSELKTMHLESRAHEQKLELDLSPLNRITKKLKSVMDSIQYHLKTNWPRVPETTVVALMNPDQRLRQFKALQRANSELESGLKQFHSEVAKVFVDMLPSSPSVTYHLNASTLRTHHIREWLPSFLIQLGFCYLLMARTSLTELGLHKQRRKTIDSVIVGGLEERDFDDLYAGTLRLERSAKDRLSQYNLGIREVDSHRVRNLRKRWKQVASLRSFIGSISLFADSVSPSTRFSDRELDALRRWTEFEETVVNTLREQVRDTSLKLKAAVGESKKGGISAELGIGTSRIQSFIARLWEEMEDMEQGLTQDYDDENWTFFRSVCDEWTLTQNKLSEQALSGVLEHLESARLHRTTVEQRLKDAHAHANRTEEMKRKLEKDLHRVRETVNEQSGAHLPSSPSNPNHKEEIFSTLVYEKRRTDNLDRVRDSIVEECRATYTAKLEKVRNETNRSIRRLQNNAETKYEDALREYGERFGHSMKYRISQAHRNASMAAARRKDLEHAISSTDRLIKYTKGLEERMSNTCYKRARKLVSSRMIRDHLNCVYQQHCLQRLLKLLDEYEKIPGTDNAWRRKFLWNVFFHYTSYSTKFHQTVKHQLQHGPLAQAFSKT